MSHLNLELLFSTGLLKTSVTNSFKTTSVNDGQNTINEKKKKEDQTGLGG